MGAPRPPRRRPRALLVGLTAAGLLLAGGGVTAALVLTRGDDGAGPNADGGDRGRPLIVQPTAIGNGSSVLSGPGDEWRVHADDLLAGSTLSELRYDEVTSTSAIPLGDTLVVSVSTEDEELVVGLDARSGETLWSRPGPAYSQSCWAVFADTRLLCHDIEAGQYAVLDPEDGRELHTGPVPWISGVASTGSTTYLVHGFEDTGDELDYDLEVVALDGAGYATAWTQTLTDVSDTEDDPNAYDGGPLVDLDGSELLVAYGPQTWRLDTRDGAITETAYDYDDLDRGGYRVAVEYDDYDESSYVVVTDDSGNAILNAPGDPWYDPDYRGVVDGRVGVGSALYDLASGAALWERDDLYASDEYGISNSWRWADDPDVVLVDDPDVDGGQTLVDAASGDTLYYAYTQLYDENSAFTDDAVVIGNDFGDLEVVSLATGEVAWDEALSDVVDPSGEGESYWSDVVVTDSTLAVLGESTVVGYTGFGPAPDELVAGDGDSGDEGDGEGDSDEGGTSYATDCGSEPVFTPVESAAAYGGVTVEFTVTAVCPGGQWLSSSGQTLTMTADTELGSEVYASGVFDFSGDPLWVPDPDAGDAVTVPFTFPIDGVFATTDEINDAIASEVVHVDCVRDPDAYAGAVPSDPDDGADPSDPVPATSSGQDPAAAEESALAALRRIAAADDPYLATTFEGSWVPQLSSKVQGTQDDGITYTYEDILAEHLRLRLRYPDVRLAQSSDWKSFLVPGYWVTLVGLTSPRPGPALGFCEASGFTVDHCYAKRLLREGPPEGSTKHRR